MTVRLGIAITTYNRREIVCAQVAAIAALTTQDYELVVCDDGSRDGTAAALRQAGVMVIAGVNRGIAWNKNRGIYYLREVCGCDIVILLDDDMLPVTRGWQLGWVEAARRFGHVNFMFDGLEPGLREVDCTPARPGLTASLLGCCMAIHRVALSMAGYMDPRFLKYGHEHTEYSIRILRCGYGGRRVVVGGEVENRFFVLGSGVRFVPVKGDHTEDDIRINTEIWSKIQSEPGSRYRLPWHSEAQFIDFVSEIQIPLSSRGMDLPVQAADFWMN